MSRFTRIGLVSLVTIAVGGFFIHAAQDKKPTAEAEIIVIKLDEGTKKTDTFNEDYISTQSQLLASQLVAQVAVKLGNLDKLASLKGTNSVDEVRSAIKVEHSKNLNNPILKVGIVGLPSQDALVVLDAVINAYQQHVKEAYANSGLEAVKDIVKQLSDLQKKIEADDQAINDFYRNSPHLITRRTGGMTPLQTSSSKLAQMLLSLSLDHAQMTATLNTLTEASKQPGTAEAVKNWVKEKGGKTEKGPKDATVDEYLSVMRLEVVALENRRESLQREHTSMLADIRDLTKSEAQIKNLMEKRARLITDHSNLNRLLKAVELQNTVILVRVITKPHFVE